MDIDTTITALRSFTDNDNGDLLAYDSKEERLYSVGVFGILWRYFKLVTWLERDPWHDCRLARVAEGVHRLILELKREANGYEGCEEQWEVVERTIHCLEDLNEEQAPEDQYSEDRVGCLIGHLSLELQWAKQVTSRVSTRSLNMPLLENG